MTRGLKYSLAAVALVLCDAAMSADVARVPAVTQQPRAFGYVIGDLAEQRILLEANGKPFTLAELPTSGPAGNWVERRAVRTETDARGHRWLAVEYQIMNSPQALTAISVPGFRLLSKNGNVELNVPEWQITVAPLTPRQPYARVGLGELRPDRAASLVDLAPIRQRLVIWLTALASVMLAWIGWYALRNWRASTSQPFARALRELRGADESSPQAWYAVHRAFDATAGRAVQAEALGALFERAPQLESRRAVIERFFASSAARFFGAAPAEDAPSLRALCADLRRIEKRHER